MAFSTRSSPLWLPASWLYVGVSARRSWTQLNSGDRLIVVVLALLGAAIPVRLAVATGGFVGESAPQWTGAALGGLGFGIVALTWTVGLASVRSAQLFQFMGETHGRKAKRIVLEAFVACLLSVLIVLAAWGFMGQGVPAIAIIQAMGIACVGHFLVYGVQYLGANKSPSLANPTGLTGLARRSAFAPAIATSFLGNLPPTSSKFLLKANTNPLIWGLVLLTLLASGGAAISAKSPLLALSTLSTVLLIIQLTLAEPRVGNGVTIGASSKNMPIARAVSDLFVLAVPHLGCFGAALILIILAQDKVAAAIGVSQLVLTLWIIWMSLLVRALPPLIFTKSTRWLVAAAVIASQVMPPLIVVLMVIATLISTRDLMRLSGQGPALWPR